MTIPLFFGIGCAPVTPPPNEAPPISGIAICEETRAARADLSAALADTQDERVLMSGALLIRLVDAACR